MDHLIDLRIKEAEVGSQVKSQVPGHVTRVHYIARYFRIIILMMPLNANFTSLVDVICQELKCPAQIPDLTSTEDVLDCNANYVPIVIA